MYNRGAAFQRGAQLDTYFTVFHFIQYRSNNNDMTQHDQLT